MCTLIRTYNNFKYMCTYTQCIVFGLYAMRTCSYTDKPLVSSYVYTLLINEHTMYAVIWKYLHHVIQLIFGEMDSSSPKEFNCGYILIYVVSFWM